MSADDRVAVPVFLAAGAKGEQVEEMVKRPTLDVWLEAPMGDEAEAEAALLKFLQV